MTRILPAWLVAAVLCATPTVTLGGDETAPGDGRYEGVAASDNTVWVVDTRTGRVRKCTQEFSDRAPTCTPMSD